ncbi:MAG: serine/threonine protein kinase [Sandaracinaceae bacterium]|nr:serine/threonine protein kinase [Sandaracinaceae bacterium]
MAHPQPAPADPKIGMVLQDRYRIVRKLGDGGMGSVYEGEHVLIKRRVAIKVLHPQFAQNPEITARFQREAEAATSIGHPNIVEVTDMGSFPDGSAYMVLEFLDGRDWAKDIKDEGPQPLGKVVHILSQVCDALTAAHAKGIVHRDLKPENIFLIARHGDPCFAKVVDFGISKIVDSQESDRSLTQTGTALGTPYYMAPEQCQGKKDVDLRADVYALGVILFQALTAQYPFDDESYPMLVLKICTEPPPSIAAFRADVPPQLQDVLHRMLAKNRDHRFSSCAEVKAALAPYAGYAAAPVLAANAPRTALHGPSVLAAAEGGARAATPTGTAYLPGSEPISAPGIGSAPTLTPYPLERGSSGRGLVLGVVAMLGLIVLVGGGLGAYFALRSPGVSHANADVAATPAPVGTPPPEAPAAQPAHAAEAAGPSEAAPSEAAPSEPSAVQVAEERVMVTITAPDGVRVYLDGQEIPTPTFRGPIPRGTHNLRASGEGFRDFERDVPFNLEGQEYPVPIQRVRAGGGGASVGQRPPYVPPYVPPYNPPQTQDTARPVGPTTRTRSGGGQTIQPEVIF